MASVELTHVRNLTSQTDIFIASGSLSPLDVADLGPHSLAFHVTASARVGHQVSLTGQVIMKKRPVKFEATGKIASIEADEETKSSKFEIHLHQFDKMLWKNLLLQLEEDRERFDKIFNSIRGEDW